MAREAQHNAPASWSCSAPARSGPTAGSAAPGRHQSRDPPAQPGILVSGIRHPTIPPADDPTKPETPLRAAAARGRLPERASAAATRFKALASDAHFRETSSRAPGAADPFPVARGNVVRRVARWRRGRAPTRPLALCTRLVAGDVDVAAGRDGPVDRPDMPQRPPNVGAAPPRPTGPSPSTCRFGHRGRDSNQFRKPTRRASRQSRGNKRCELTNYKR